MVLHALDDLDLDVPEQHLKRTQIIYPSLELQMMIPNDYLLLLHELVHGDSSHKETQFVDIATDK